MAGPLVMAPLLVLHRAVLVRQLDAALDEAKRDGRNAVRIAEIGVVAPAALGGRRY